MEIVANHAHVMPAPLPGIPPGDEDSLLRYLDECGIARAVVFPPSARRFDNSLRKVNQWAWDIVRRHPTRLIPAGYVFPLAADVLDILQMFHDEGVRLAKIHPSVDQYDIADGAARRCYARAEELGIILDFHTGPHNTRLSLATPQKFDDVAWDHPRLKMVFEHLGGRAYFEEFLAILCNHPAGQLFGGLTSVLHPQTSGLWYLGPERIADLVRFAGADKLIFGLDFPFNSVESSRKAIAVISELDVAPEDKERILGGTLLRLLGM